MDKGQQFNGVPSPEDMEKATGMSGRDLHTAGHAGFLFDETERILGKYQDSVRSEAATRMIGFPEHMRGEDEHGPFVHHTSGGYTSKWYGGSYIEHVHPKHGAVDVTNVTSKGNLPVKMSPEQLVEHHNNFLNDLLDNRPRK